MTGLGDDPAESSAPVDAPAPLAGCSRPILPGQPTLTVGRIVAYLGFRREGFRYAGIFKVRSFDNCFSVSCPPTCDRFLYYLEPLDPAACGLEAGFGIAAHGVAALTPADDDSITSRNPS